MRTGLAWCGLLLMLVSLVWLEEIAPSGPPPAGLRHAPAREAVMLVVIDAGHGGNDSGAIAADVLEKNLALDVAQRLDRLVRARGLSTLLTRSGDEYVSLGQRAAAANHQRDCVFVSIHFDDADRAAASGIGTFYAAQKNGLQPALVSWLPFLQRISAVPANNGRSQSLAGFVEETLVERTKAVNRGARPEQFYVIANVRHPAILIEGGFLTNKEDVEKLIQPEYREKLAGAISDGIIRYRDAFQEEAAEKATGAPGA